MNGYDDTNIFARILRKEIPAAVERDMGIVLGSAFGQGFLTRRADDEVRAKPIWLAETRQQQLLKYYELLDQSGMPAFETPPPKAGAGAPAVPMAATPAGAAARRGSGGTTAPLRRANSVEIGNRMRQFFDYAGQAIASMTPVPNSNPSAMP